MTYSQQAGKHSLKKTEYLILVDNSVFCTTHSFQRAIILIEKMERQYWDSLTIQKVEE